VTDRIKFEDFGEKPTGQGVAGQGTMACEACEAMCLDAVDGTLTAAEQAVFDRHVAGCVECAEQLSEARRGAAWMEMLKGHRPEPPAGMLQRILAQTSEAEMSRVFPRFGQVPTPVFNVVPKIGFQERMLDKFAATFSLDLRQSHFQPRMAMTAAMAFFSLALTMNLSGVRLTDLKPGAIHRTVADVRASASRSFQNLKVVYQVESKVNELRNDDRDPAGPFAGTNGSSSAPKQQAPAAQPAPQQQKPKDKQDVPQGTSELRSPGLRMERVLASNEQQVAPGADASRVQRGA
jgi:hypothetical protein